MREILFRGKRVDNGEWEVGYAVKGCDRENQMFIAKSIGVGFFTGGITACEVKPETIGQFTGRCDENYNKIFEGDILEVSYDDGAAYTTEVCAYGGTLCVDVEGEDYDFTAIDFAVDIWKNNCCECKVIGNIYENPELLEEL